MRSYLATVRAFSRNVRLILVAQAMIGLGLQGLFYLLINLYLLRLGYSIEFIGIFGGVGVLVIALFSVPATVIGDRIGSRRALILAMSLSALGLALMLFSELLPSPARDLWLLASYAVTWLGGTLNLVNAYPFLMANSSPAERDHVFSVYTASQPLAAVVGAVIGGLLPGLLAGVMGATLKDPAPYRYALWVSVPCYLVALLAVTLTDQTTREEPRRTNLEATLSNASAPSMRFPLALVGIMMLIAFFKIFGEIATRGFVTAYMDEALAMPASLIGFLYGVAQFVAVPAALAAPVLIRRLGLGRTLPLSIVALAAGALPLALVATAPAAAAGLFAVFMAAALSLTSLTLFHQQIVDMRWRTTMSGSVNMASAVGMTIVSFLGGYAITAWGYNAFFGICAGLTAVASILYWAYFGSPPDVASTSRNARGEVSPESCL